ncbi:MAG: APC family permease, partial [Cellulomonas sp.]|nr:APC family permease [Cellulomonas sp.]
MPVDAKEQQLSHKGLAKGSIGVVGAVAIGVSCIAPDYTLTATLGSAAGAVGQFTPAIVWLGLIPMLFVALGYRELNRAIPDSGTSFTWGARAVGPRFGWLTGWGLIASTIVVLASLAQIAVVFLYETVDWIVGRIVGHDWTALADLNGHAWFNVLSVVALTAAATWMCYHDLKLTARFQYVMVAFQLAAVFIFAAVAIWQHTRSDAPQGPDAPQGLDFSLDWFNPISAISQFGVSGLITGLTVAVFIYWGWDVVLTITEETRESQKTPGRAATLTILIITVYYLFVVTAVIMFAGVGTDKLGLNGAGIQEGENVFATLAVPVLGSGAAILVYLAVLSSSLASLESTFISPARTMLAMGHYGGLNRQFAKTSRHATPGTATIVAGCVAGGYYAVMRPISDNILGDTMLTTAIFICFYYGLTSFAAVWYFRRQWSGAFGQLGSGQTRWAAVRKIFFQLVFPGVGGLFLAFMFFHELIASASPDYGSGSNVGGLGLVFILSAIILLLGVALLIYNNIRNPEFFAQPTTTVPRGVAEGDGLDPHFHALTDA